MDKKLWVYKFRHIIHDIFTYHLKDSWSVLKFRTNINFWDKCSKALRQLIVQHRARVRLLGLVSITVFDFVLEFSHMSYFVSLVWCRYGHLLYYSILRVF